MNTFLASVIPTSGAGAEVPLWLLLPFTAMLLAIALMPFVFKHHWERAYHYWALFFGTIGVTGYLATGGSLHRVLDTAHEYVGFIALIGSLFVVAGGIHISVKGEAKPWVNVVFLAVAALTANVIGTTGASMLFIRPWIRMNRYRITGFHIVFFIFIVANVGGCLTPIGDPPLFLGYLRGVPFWWVLTRCWQPWAVALGTLLALFFVADTFNFRRAPVPIRDAETREKRWRVTGLRNLGFLAIILGAVFVERPLLLREAIMVAAAALSWFVTPKDLHRANSFNTNPIREVAWLFLGIFATMIPALDYLQAHAAGFGLRSPMHYYWATGALSGVLDNAPTYLAFLAAAFGSAGLSMDTGMHEFIASHDRTLVAISISAVFFGAMTYIGNGPNFMVKAIAEHAKVRSPDFFRYIWAYSLPILLPVLVLVALIFLR